MEKISAGKKLFQAHQQSLDVFYANNIDSDLFDRYQDLIVNRISSKDSLRARAGRIFFVSCGKTLSICNKVSNMLNSLDISSQSLNASECLHGDIGSIDCSNPNNVVVFVSVTGETAEVVSCVRTLLRKIEFMELSSVDVPLFLTLTGNKSSRLHEIVSTSGISIPLNYENIIRDETFFHNVNAPTLSLQLLYLFMDCLFVDIVEQLSEKGKLRKQFVLNHPGGGLAHA